MISKKVKWYPLFASIEEMNLQFRGSEKAVVKSMFGEFLLVRENETYMAFTNRCPHQNKPLDNCRLEKDQIICPYHQYAFSFEDGKGMGLYLQKYPLEFRENGIYIGIEKWSLF